MASPKTQIRRTFPKLSLTDLKVTSPPDLTYNCIAWAAGEEDRFWWPSPQSYWPTGLPLITNLKNFIDAFSTLGYTPCDSFHLEDGFEKVAIYIDPQTSHPKHMARQLPNGTWTSKLGPQWDIQHKTLIGLEGIEYGQPVRALRRPLE